MNSILTYVFLLSRWVRAVCSVVEIASFQLGKGSVKTLASWSMHAHSARPGNPSGLVNVDLSKGERDRTVFQYSRCSHACFSVICLEASIEVV
jgi:hypothetical protein